MPKTQYTNPVVFFADVETRFWRAKQDWTAKFDKLSKTKKEYYEGLAGLYNPTPETTKTPKKQKASTARAIFVEKHVQKGKTAGLTVVEAKKIASLQWGNLSEEEKFAYERRALREKEKLLKSTD